MVASRKKKLEGRLGMEKNAAGHRLKINKDFVGYFESARQQGGSRWVLAGFGGVVDWMCWEWRICGGSGGICLPHQRRCSFIHALLGCLLASHAARAAHAAADVEEKEVVPAWKVLEPDPLRNKGPVAQVGGCHQDGRRANAGRHNRGLWSRWGAGKQVGPGFSNLVLSVVRCGTHVGGRGASSREAPARCCGRLCPSC